MNKIMCTFRINSYIVRRRLASKDDERTLESVMASYDLPLSPEDLSVSPKFSLHPMAPSGGGSYPYEVAVDELRLMTQLSSPLNKLACLGRSCLGQ